MTIRLHRIHRFSLILPLTALMAACSSNSADIDSEEAPAEERIVDPADSSIYFLGRSEGLSLLDCETKNDICDRLLDLRAREHIIRTQIGESSADAYIYGIEDAVSESGDTLINVIAPAHPR